MRGDLARLCSVFTAAWKPPSHVILCLVGRARAAEAPACQPSRSCGALNLAQGSQILHRRRYGK